MDRAPHKRNRAARVREGLSDRAIFGAGITAGVAAAVASLFSTAPGRVVEKAVDLVAPEPERRFPAIDPSWMDHLQAGRFGEAARTLATMSADRPSSARRFARYFCTLWLGQWTDEAMRELEQWVRDRSAEASTDGASSPGAHDLDFLVGPWVAMGDRSWFSADIDVVRLVDGRAYLLCSSGPRGPEMVALFLFDAQRDVWTRTMVNLYGTATFSEGAVVDGELQLEGGPTTIPPQGAPTFRMTMRPCEDGSFEHMLQRLQDDGLWMVLPEATYERAGPGAPDITGR